MYNFPCTPDCPLEIYADWLEDHDLNSQEIRLLAKGWISPGYLFECSFLPEEANEWPTFCFGNGCDIGQGGGDNLDCGHGNGTGHGNGNDYGYAWYHEVGVAAGDGYLSCDGTGHGYHLTNN